METAAAKYCQQCGRAFDPSQIIAVGGANVCAECKPAFLRKIQEGVAVAPTAIYKGFWIRFLAKILDGILLDIVIYTVAILTGLQLFRQIAVLQPGQPPNPALMAQALEWVGLLWILSMAVFILYNTLMLGKFGTTMGKMAIGAKVITADGSPLTYGRALARTLMEVVNMFTLDIGYLIAAFDEKKRGLHDRVAGTLVVAK